MPTALAADAPEKGLAAPHRPVETTDARERFALDLFDDLWLRYRGRVSYVQTYEKLVLGAGATFVNDHIAFRTFACESPKTGIHSISRVFEALGYVGAACYSFPDKHLSSIHYQHPNARFPKLFISELKTWELPPEARKAILRSLKTHRAAPSDATLADLRSVGSLPAAKRAALLKTLVHFFSQLPWKQPQRKDVLALDKESQFAAWVLVHGYDVNHFTASINSHGVPELDDIEKTVNALRDAGVPMKVEIEGERGSKLRQSATEAVIIPIAVKDGTKSTRMPWTYAYFEIAERGEVADPDTGAMKRFEGFLGGQATQLFDMTKLKR
ncbi:MAG: DUF1338 domain-containing protein [Elusimicrobia bacterium]|nr:DUF1338 domain-containing protein [Elusimicrobiota bacterium]